MNRSKRGTNIKVDSMFRQAPKPEQLHRLIGVFLLLGASLFASAQGYKSHWIFGHGYHMEFLGGVPVMRPRIEGFTAREGPSTVSDSDGNLLFYTNAELVWNAAHESLLNSGDMVSSIHPGLGSTITNGSLFVPWPGDTMERFYALCLIDVPGAQLRISKIDRNLDGGLGGVVPGMKTFFESPMLIGEQIAAVRHGNGQDWWIVARRQVDGSTTRGFLAFLLTPNGVDAIVESPHIEVSSPVGELVFSQDGERMAYAGFTFSGNSWIGHYSFDRCIGLATILDSIGRINDGDRFYGLAFNENGEKLYASSERTHSLYELSVLNDTLAPNLMFRVHLGGLTIGNTMGALELAPNGRIYASMAMTSLINVDTSYGRFLGDVNPLLPYNLAYDTFAILLPDTPNSTASLPNFPNYELGPLVGSPCDSLSPPIDTTSAVGPQFPETSWSVFPTIGEGRFQLEGLPAQAQIAAFDAMGRKVHSEAVATEPGYLDLQHLPPGPYWLVAHSREGAHLGLRKLVVQR